MRLIRHEDALVRREADAALAAAGRLLAPANDADVLTLPLEGVEAIALNWPKFTDGRASSQAVRLRRRGFRGLMRATGDVRVDQVQALWRLGFDEAELAPGEDPAVAERLLAMFDAGRRFYQADAQQPQSRLWRQPDVPQPGAAVAPVVAPRAARTPSDDAHAAVAA